MKIALLLADGFEEIEALTPVDVIRRAGLTVDTISIADKCVIGSHGISVFSDFISSEVDINSYDTVILPGGMPGAKNLDSSNFVTEILDSTAKRGGRLAAICAAPLVLGHRGYLNGKKATCYPGFEAELYGAEVISRGVVTDGNITTAKGMGVALDFAKELVSLLLNKDAAEKISNQIMENATSTD